MMRTMHDVNQAWCEPGSTAEQQLNQKGLGTFQETDNGLSLDRQEFPQT